MIDPAWKKSALCGDSRVLLKRIPKHSIDFILTDPPYNIAPYSTGNIPLPGRSALNNDVAQWDNEPFIPEEWVEEFLRILKPTGNLFIFTSYNQIGRWHQCLDAQFDTTNFMVWHKTNPAPKIFKAGFLNSCELIFTCWNKGHTWNFTSQAEMHNFIESPICMRPERLSAPKHPAQKPIAILKKILNIASNPGDIILDPFMGVGSTGVAALSLGRRFIGFERDREYFSAAQRRLNQVLIDLKSSKQKGYDEIRLSEPEVDCIGNSDFVGLMQDELPFEKDDLSIKFMLSNDFGVKAIAQPAPPTEPIIKWPGGKERELNYILPNLPHRIGRYIEPFVGGGSVFAAVPATRFVLNDKSLDLIALYRAILAQDARFFACAEAMDSIWETVDATFSACPALFQTFVRLRGQDVSEQEIKAALTPICQTLEDALTDLLCPFFPMDLHILQAELRKNLFRKITRMRVLERERHTLPDEDVKDNLETILKSSLYMYFRHLLNNQSLAKEDPSLRIALFFFSRNYAYSGMFRYNTAGEFNVPYGGIGYNRKRLKKKLTVYRSRALQERLQASDLWCEDFEIFLSKIALKSDDFIFLDPPYDTEFSTYAQNDFTREDQRRLADFLLYKCPAKWMLIIKRTDFIYNLYNKKGISIRAFDKSYCVSFMNRNAKDVVHLLITNYEV